MVKDNTAMGHHDDQEDNAAMAEAGPTPNKKAHLDRQTPCEVGASRRSRNLKCSITSSISYGPGDAPQPAEDPEAVKKLQSGNDPPGRNPKRRGIWPPSDTRGTDADMSTTPDRAAAQ